jgi:hypothetical protein
VDGEIVLFDLSQAAFGKLACRFSGKSRNRGQKYENHYTQGQFYFHGNFASEQQFHLPAGGWFSPTRESLCVAVSGVKAGFL